MGNGNGLFETSRFDVESESATDTVILLAAFDRELGRRVAIRAPSDSALANPEIAQEFDEERRLLASIHSPYVAGVLHYYEKGQIGDRGYLVTEHLPKTLEDLLKERSLDRLQALSLIAKLARGIAALHEKGVCHAGLRPSGILVSDDLIEVQIFDLGIALESGVQHKTLNLSAQYAAPENYSLDEQIDGRADLYSLGMIALECLLPREDFQAFFAKIYSDSSLGVINTRWTHWHMNVAERAPNLSEINSAIPKDLSDIVDKLLAKRRDERYFEIKEVLTDLDAISPASSGTIKPIDVSAMSDTPLVAPSFSQRLRDIPLPILLAIVFVSVSVSGFAGWHLYKKRALDSELLTLAQKVVEIRDRLSPLEVVQEYPAFVEANDGFEKARAEIDAGEARSALVDLEESYAAYLATEAKLNLQLEAAETELNNELSRMRDFVSRHNPIRKSSFLEQVDDFEGDLGAALSAQNILDVVAGLSEFSASFWADIAITPRLYQSGSSESELVDAMTLCERYSETCDIEAYATELVREVIIAPFEADTTEVSVAEFREFVNETGYRTSAEVLGYSHVFDDNEALRVRDLSWRKPRDGGSRAKERDPVMHMSFADAAAYCQWSGRRLLSEDEWEFVARGPERLIFSWGNEWIKDVLSNEPEPVSARGKSEHQHFTGNVWEWVVVPGSEEGGLKGGSWAESNPANLRLAARRDPIEGVVSIDDGIRCGRSLDAWQDLP